MTKTLRPSAGSYLMKIERIPQRYATKKGGVMKLKTFISVYGQIFSGAGCYLKAIGYANTRIKFTAMKKAKKFKFNKPTEPTVKSDTVVASNVTTNAPIPTAHMLHTPSTGMTKKGQAELEAALAKKRAAIEKLTAEANSQRLETV